MRLWPLVCAAIFTSVSLAGLPVQAGGVCGYLRMFLDPVSQKQHDAQSFYDAFGGNGQAKCNAARSLGGGSTRHCHWAFDYRSDDASLGFSQFTDAISQCFGVTSVQAGGAEVNHPDSHLFRTHEIERTTLTVSLKDKGALQQTLVFLIATHR